MKILVVDDQHERHEGFRAMLVGHSLTHAFGYTEALADLQHNTYGMLCLDHDLAMNDVVGGRALSGHDIAKWLAANPRFCPPQVIIHSHNPVGALNIELTLRSLNLNLVRRPFSYSMG